MPATAPTLCSLCRFVVLFLAILARVPTGKKKTVIVWWNHSFMILVLPPVLLYLAFFAHADDTGDSGSRKRRSLGGTASVQDAGSNAEEQHSLLTGQVSANALGPRYMVFLLHTLGGVGSSPVRWGQGVAPCTRARSSSSRQLCLGYRLRSALIHVRDPFIERMHNILHALLPVSLCTTCLLYELPGVCRGDGSGC